MSTTWGQGRTEVSMLQKEITEAVVSGRTLSAVYDDLRKDSRISITYKSFWQNAKRVLDSSNKRTQSSWGNARAEAMALRSQIRAAVSSGKPLTSIYGKLKAEGCISGSYKGFYKNVRKYCGSPRPRGSKPQPALSSVQSETTAPSRAPEAVSKSSPPPPAPARPAPAFFEERVEREPVFKRNETITLEEMI